VTSEPKTQIAYTVLRQQQRQAATLAELHSQAHELAGLITFQDLCSSCWRLYSNGTRGTSTCSGDCLLSKD